MSSRRRTHLFLEHLEDRNTPSFDFGYALGFGTAGVDIGQAVAADAAGNVAVIGTFSAGPTPTSTGTIDLDPGPGSYWLTSAGATDGFVAGYNADGTFRWGVHCASATANGALEVAVDGMGNTFAYGLFSGSVSIGALGTTPITLSATGTYEGFLVKIDSVGNVLWARTLGEDGIHRFAYGITTDNTGNVYATGMPDGTNHMFVAKYEGATGATIWSRVISGGTGKTYASGLTSFALGQDIAVDANGNVHVTGAYLGKIDFNPDPAKANWLTSIGASSPSQDAFVLSLSANGSYLWCGSMGGRGYDSGLSVALDGSSNVYVSGYFDPDSQSDFDPGRGKLALPGSGGFLLKLGANHSLHWARSGVGAVDLAVDTAGNAYLVSSFNGTIDADPGPGTFHLTSAGANDVLISKLDSAGNFLWAASLGGPAAEQGRGIALDGQGNIYTTGSFQSTADFDPGLGTYNLSGTFNDNGNPTSDVFISKLKPASTQ